jgi:hypothetical protein
MQVAVQNTIMRDVLGAKGELRVPFAVKLLQRWPVMQRIPARFVGMGARPEHVRTKAR